MKKLKIKLLKRTIIFALIAAMVLPDAVIFAKESKSAEEGLFLDEKKLEDGDTVYETDLLMWKQEIVLDDNGSADEASEKMVNRMAVDSDAGEEKQEVTIPDHLLLSEENINLATLTDSENESGDVIEDAVVLENGSIYVKTPSAEENGENENSGIDENDETNEIKEINEINGIDEKSDVEEAGEAGKTKEVKDTGETKEVKTKEIKTAKETISGNTAVVSSGTYILSIPCMIDPKAVMDGKVEIDGMILYVNLMAETDGGELPNYTLDIFKLDNPPEEGDKPLASGDKINLRDTLYVQIKKADLADIEAGLDYTIPLPDAIGSPNEDGKIDINVNLSTADGTPVTQKFAELTWKKDGSALSVKFIDFDPVDIDGSEMTLETLTNIDMSFQCKLKDDNTAANEKGEIEINLPGDKSITIVVNDWVPKEPDLKKSAGSFNSDGTVEWTINYDHPVTAYAGQVPNLLKDQLPEGMQFVDNSIVLYINDEEIAPASGDLATGIAIDSDKRLLTYDLTGIARGDKVKITYKTGLTNKELNSIWGKEGTIRYENKVEGIDTADLDKVLYSKTASVNVPNDWIGRKMLTKDAEVIRPENDTDPWKINWTVKVSTVSTNFAHLFVIDTMGKGLELDESSVQVKTGAGTDITASIGTTKETVEGNKTKLTVKLIETPGKAAESSYIITYTTKIDEKYFNQTDETNKLTDDDIKNSATLDYSWPVGDDPGDGAPEPPVIEKGPGKGIDINEKLINKKAFGAEYNPSDHSLTWEITINPHMVNLTKATIEDDLSNAELKQCFVPDGVNTADVEQEIKDAVEAKLKDISGAKLDSLTITDKKVLTMQLSDVGKKSFSFKIKTYSTDPMQWAANSGFTYKNEVKMLASGTEVNDEKIIKDSSDWDQTKPNIKIIKKENTAYDPNTNQITWKLTINESKVKLGDVEITDVLPAGLSCDAAEALLNGAAFSAGNTFTVTGDSAADSNTIHIHLENITDQAVVTFKTKVDVNSDAFQTKPEIEFTNKVSMTSESNVNPVEVESKITIENNVLKKDGIKPENTGTNRVDYTVRLNPNHMNLLEGKPAGIKLYLTDTLDTGLYLDLESIKMYEATATSNGNNGKYPVKLEKGAEVAEKPEINFDSEKNSFSLEIPDPSASYIVEYSAYVVRAGVELQNNVKLTGSAIPDDVEQGRSNMKFQMRASGSARFSLPKEKFISISIKKTDGAGNLLKGAEFGLYANKTDTNPLVKGICDDSTGICVLGLPKSETAGLTKLYWKEITAPTGYKLNDEWHEIEMDEFAATGNVERTMQNFNETDSTTGSIHILKTDGTNPLKGAKFKLYADAECTIEVKDEASTDENGKLVFDGLYPTRNYWVKETAAPEGYLLSEAPVKIEAKKDASETTITNEKYNVSLLLTKVDAEDTDLLLKGAEFSLYQNKDENGVCSEQVGTAQTTDDNGQCSFDGLKPDSTYYLQETKAASGYEINDDVFTIQTEENNVTIDFGNAANHKIGWNEKASIKITKTDSEKDEKLSGAVFRLYEEDKITIVSEKTTDDQGICTFENLKAGTYFIREIQAPKGYEMTDEWYEKEVAVNTAETITITNNVEGWNKKASIEITKTDETESLKLSDAVFALYKEDKATLIEEKATDQDGILTFSNLAEGTYYLKETKAPQGYVLNDQWIEAAVKMNTEQKLTVKNKLVPKEEDPSDDPTDNPPKDPVDDPPKDPSKDPSKDPVKDPSNEPAVNPGTSGGSGSSDPVSADPAVTAASVTDKKETEDTQNSIPKTDVQDHIPLWAAGLILSLFGAVVFGTLMLKEKNRKRRRVDKGIS